ncbi:MAG: alkane 1-monooxygenase [Sneathiella sp.]
MPHYSWYFLTYSIAGFVLAGLYFGGWVIWLAPFWTFGFVPLFDHFRGVDTGNVPSDLEAVYSKSIGYKAVVWAWIPLQTLVLILAALKISSTDMSLAEVIGTAIAVGIMTGSIGITWAHELCHRTGRFERGLAEFLLSQVSYAHFCIEHVYGHHRNVATPKDPATSRLGESFYAFLPRTLWGSFQNAWQIEKQQLVKKGRPFFDFRNRMLRYLFVQIVLFVGIAALLGGKTLLFFIGQASVAVILLETINYLEHYGLVRRKLENGRYEKVQPWHSWNASQIVSNLSLINLARHSDHHFMASRRYQILRHYDEAPQLPSGYAAMVLVALVPPLWFRMMNPLVTQWRDEHLPAE